MGAAREAGLGFADHLLQVVLGGDAGREPALDFLHGRRCRIRRGFRQSHVRSLAPGQAGHRGLAERLATVGAELLVLVAQPSTQVRHAGFDVVEFAAGIVAA
jgi:hypothetical protein